MLFQFVDHGDRKVLERDRAVASVIDQQLIAAKAELTGALSEIDKRRRYDRTKAN